MSSRAGLILSVSAAAALLVFAGTAGAQRENPGETIMLQQCQGCHNVRVIQTSALDADAWTKIIERDAKDMPKDEIPVLVKYLVLNHGPVPEDAGKEILLNTCTMCHDLGRIKAGRRTAEEWEETLISMLNEGAPLSDQQFPIIHRYLSRHFGISD